MPKTKTVKRSQSGVEGLNKLTARAETELLGFTKCNQPKMNHSFLLWGIKKKRIPVTKKEEIFFFFISKGKGNKGKEKQKQK